MSDCAVIGQLVSSGRNLAMGLWPFFPGNLIVLEGGPHKFSDDQK